MTGKRRPPTVLTADEKQAVVDMRRQGTKITVIARRSGVPARTIYKWCKTAGLTHPRRPTAARNDAIVARLQAGHPVDVVAAEFDLSGSWVRGIAAAAGVKVGRPSGGRRSAMWYADPADVGRMYWEELLTPSEIAAKFGVHRHTVLVFMGRHGIPRRDPRRSPQAAAVRQAERRRTGRRL